LRFRSYKARRHVRGCSWHAPYHLACPPNWGILLRPARTRVNRLAIVSRGKFPTRFQIADENLEFRPLPLAQPCQRSPPVVTHDQGPKGGAQLSLFFLIRNRCSPSSFRGFATLERSSALRFSARRRPRAPNVPSGRFDELHALLTFRFAGGTYRSCGNDVD
jgi:hypothetical protein